MNNKENSPVFIVTIDTESDDAWKKPEIISLENLNEIPRFQDLCEKYDVIPTYLLTYECASRDKAISIFKPILDRGKCEIGHHLHVWSTPPFQKKNQAGDIDLEWIHAYQFELPDTLFEEKAETLKKVIKENFGIYPTSHRAGRFGIDQRGIDWLIKHNFEVDTSVAPLNSFAPYKGKNQGGPNFYSTLTIPYLWKNSLSNSSLVEIPISVYYPTIFFKKDFFKKGLGKKIGNRFGSRRLLSLNPEFSLDFNKKIIRSEIQKKKPTLNLFLHSSELAMNCSPFTKNLENYEKVWSILEQTFSFIKMNGIKSLSLTQTARHLIKSQTIKV